MKSLYPSRPRGLVGGDLSCRTTVTLELFEEVDPHDSALFIDPNGTTRSTTITAGRTRALLLVTSARATSGRPRLRPLKCANQPSEGTTAMISPVDIGSVADSQVRCPAATIRNRVLTTRRGSSPLVLRTAVTGVRSA